MPVLPYGSDAWLIHHPALSQNPADYNLQPLEKGEKRPKTDVYQISYEFMDFLRKWDMGDYGPSDFHTRNFVIATRKSCFPDPLMNGLGMWTESGKTALERANVYKRMIDRYYLADGRAMSEIPQWQDAEHMDTIVLAAAIQTKHIVFLKELYVREHPPQGGIPLQFSTRMPSDIHFEYQTYANKTYAMTAALRDYPQRRKDFEFMVRLGLIGLQKLPKPLKEGSRGRAPVGAFLTEAGKRFFEDFQYRFDPGVKRIADMRRMMASD